MHPEPHLHRPPHRHLHHPYRPASASSSNHGGSSAGLNTSPGAGGSSWNSRRQVASHPSKNGSAGLASTPPSSALDGASRILRPISVSSTGVTTTALPRVTGGAPPKAVAMSTPRPPHAYHPRATIMITGMRGSGKTTLGLMAATAFSRKFIDLDSALEASMGQSIPSFVSRHGWAAFRSREAATLQSVLARHPYDAVIACGGGIVEGVESRELLKNSRDRCPVIVVLRERAAVERFLIEESQNADVAAGIWDVMSRREPHFMDCASHIFAVLSAERPEIPSAPDSEAGKAAAPQQPEPVHPLSLKKMERSFLRLIRFVLSDPSDGSPAPSRPSSPATQTSISALLNGPRPSTSSRPDAATSSPVARSTPPRYHTFPPPTFECLPGGADATSRSSLLTRRTTFLTVTHPDLRHARAEDFAHLVEGVDALALRIDLMDCMRPASAAVRKRQIASGDPAAKAAPQVDYHEVAFQVERARQFAGDVPLLFIVRSDREGGEFFDDRDLRNRNTASPFSQAVYYRLAEVALQMGVELLDIELGWDPAMIKALIAKRGRTRIIATYHDLQGHLRWDTPVAQQLYDRARSFEGIDVVEMIGRSSATEPEQNFHLLCFQAQVMATAAADPTRSLPPLISVNSGEAGRATRPFNACLSPVSHDLQSRKAAPGQMTMREIIRCQTDLGFIVKRHFSVLLDAREASQRATLATIDAGFETMGLPREFHIMEREWLQELGTPRRLPRFLSAEHRRAAIVGSSFPREQRLLFQVFLALPATNTSIVSGGDEGAEASRLESDPNGSSSPASTDPSLLGPPLTLAAVAVRAVDVCAVADVSQRKLGAPEGRMIPHGFCSLPGPMVGDHTLPRALQRLVSDNLSPINAPGPSSAALVIVLPPATGSEESVRDALRVKTEIETRAAIFALGRLSFGRCAVVDLWQDSEGAEDASPSSSWFGTEVAEVVRARPNPLGLHSADPPKFEVQRLPASALRDMTAALSRSSPPRSVGTATPKEEPSTLAAQTSSPASTLSSLHASPTAPHTRLPARSPAAVVLVGGTERSQLQALATLLKPGPSSPTAPPEPSGSATWIPGSALPESLWDTHMGGTVVRLPTAHDPTSGEAEAFSELRLEPRLERYGWIHVGPEMVEFEQTTRGAFEPFTRRRPPRPDMAEAWRRARAPAKGEVAK